MSFFKKKDEDRKTIRPKLRPANFGSEPKEKSGTSGKGGGEAKPAYDVNAKGWSEQVAKFNAKGGINNDGKFGYGYVDTETGIEVPWYIDMINGGGANAAGDTFVSPFEGTPMGLPAQAVTGGLNALNVAPYGSNRPRYFMPMEAARVDAEGKPVQVDQGAAPSGRGAGGGSSSVRPVLRPVADPYAPIGESNPAVAAEIARRQEALRMQSYEPISSGSNLPNLQQDFSDISSAPTIRSGLVGYNPQVVAYNAGYTPAPTQGVTDEVYLPAGTQTGSSLRSQTMAQAQRARDYMNYKNAGGKSSYEEWNAGTYR